MHKEMLALNDIIIFTLNCVKFSIFSSIMNQIHMQKFNPYLLEDIYYFTNAAHAAVSATFQLCD